MVRVAHGAIYTGDMLLLLLSLTLLAPPPVLTSAAEKAAAPLAAAPLAAAPASPARASATAEVDCSARSAFSRWCYAHGHHSGWWSCVHDGGGGYHAVELPLQRCAHVHHEPREKRRLEWGVYNPYCVPPRNEGAAHSPG